MTNFNQLSFASLSGETNRSWDKYKSEGKDPLGKSQAAGKEPFYTRVIQSLTIISMVSSYYKDTHKKNHKN